ncbi:hypothetical protein WNA58_001148 [Vibrio cholerae]|uniref:DUF91 domain-containing protein n=1 Tax=Vibrio tarriae TaxID=2014742 RepID=A0AAU8WI60_9VIBR|nr:MULTISPECIES: hypothetical protein [Vibrio]USN27250.1 hypothetical protein [synthetic construct]HAS6171797.1 hypothetical protein [Vibrio vulnificus]ASK55749.1 hypothetical protein CEQ48_13510 [Vibrio tarriae]EEY43696.1 hypothetical protein VMA_001758 [Vibrio mimicus VM223]EGR1092526.1 hypothetical protein [Vibrio cholerae]
MSLYNISNKNLTALTQTTFAAEGLQERQDLQEALKGCIDAIAPDCLVISEEFSDWEDSRRRIDLLAIDRNANLVVIELKRDEIGAHMELQALRYAAMISTMTFDKACEYFERYIAKEGLEINARETILEFVDLDENSLDDFGNDVRIVLASADFGKELTTSVLWLRDKGIDISCVRLTPYRYKDDVLINAEQIIPVPEVEAYQVKFREKQAEQRTSKNGQRDYSKYRFNGQVYNKRKLALAVITHWINDKQPMSLAEVQRYLNSFNLPRAVSLFEHIADKHLNRYHSSESDRLMLVSGEQIAISNQWGDNIPNLLQAMEPYGYEIVKVEN